MSLRHVALGVALTELDHGVVEVGGENRGPRIRRFLANCEPPIHVAAPWCAAFIQYIADVAARDLPQRNPLDDVRLEAYVQSYYDWAKDTGRRITAEEATYGDLVLFNFGGSRWDHIGIILRPPTPTWEDGCRFQGFTTVEGNTNDGVFKRRRQVGGGYPTSFIAWDAQERTIT